MLSNLLAVILVGGLPVLWSYYTIKLEDEDVSRNMYIPVLTDFGYMRYVWMLSMVLTIISYIIVAYAFIWGTEDGAIWGSSPDTMEPYLCGIYVLFLANAGHWVRHVVYDIYNKKKSIWLMLNMYVTAVLSIVIGVIAFGIQDIDSTLQTFAHIGGGILIFHHVLIDALYWYCLWDIDYDGIV